MYLINYGYNASFEFPAGQVVTTEEKDSVSYYKILNVKSFKPEKRAEPYLP